MVVTNYAGNVVEWTGTESEALAAGLNVNCTDCRYCTDCTNCRYCTDCTNCKDCTDCRYCTDCTNCRYCTNCTDCTDCTNCRYCTNCTDCTNCTNCRYCRYCTDCRYCRYCTDCTNCTNCMVQPKANLVTGVFVVTVRQDNTVKIGCQDRTKEEWLAFSEEQLSGMSDHAIEFMKLWKPVILAIVDQPSKETT